MHLSIFTFWQYLVLFFFIFANLSLSRKVSIFSLVNIWEEYTFRFYDFDSSFEMGGMLRGWAPTIPGFPSELSMDIKSDYLLLCNHMILRMICTISAWVFFSYCMVFGAILNAPRRLGWGIAGETRIARNYNIKSGNLVLNSCTECETHSGLVTLYGIRLMASCLFSTKPLPKALLTYCQLDPMEYISMKFYLRLEHFCYRKCFWKCQPFCSNGIILMA